MYILFVFMLQKVVKRGHSGKTVPIHVVTVWTKKHVTLSRVFVKMAASQDGKVYSVHRVR